MRRARAGIAIATSITLVLQPLLVEVARAQQIVDPSAPLAFRPSLGGSANGTPVVNIAPPSFGGVSHNKFQQYNVDTRGVILNNSGLGGTSIIGGAVGANPNLVGKMPASVIVNQVTGSSASILNGPTEVFGQSAQVIVANPNGVTCASCSFINASQVTLASAVPDPNYQTGAISYSVSSGTVQIAGSGISGAAGQPLGPLSLIGRQLSIQAPIVSSDTVRLVAGAGVYDQAANLMSASASAPAVTGPAIQSAAAGTIRAGTISVLSTDANLGVALTGQLSALSGPLTIRSAGDVLLAGSASNRDLTVAADGAITLYNQHRSVGRMVVTGNSVAVDASASLTANDSVLISVLQSLVSRGVIRSGASISVAANGTLTASGEVTANGQVILQAQTISAANLKLTGSQVQVLGAGVASLDAVGIVATAGDVHVTSPRLELGQGTAFIAPGTLYLDAADRLINSTVIDYANLQLSVRNGLVNTGTGAILADNLALTLTDAVFNDGTLYGRRSLALAAATLANGSSGVIAGPSITINLAGAASNAGAIVAGTVQSDGSIRPDGTLTLTAQSYVAGSPAALVAADNARLIVAGAFDNAGTVLGQSLASLQAGSIVNRASAQILGGVVALATTSGDLANAGTIIAGRGMTLNVAGNFVNGGVVGSLSGDLAVAAGGILASSGRIVAAGDLTVDAASYLGLTGNTELGGQTLTLRVSGDVANAGTIAAQTALGLSAATLDNAAGGAIAGGAVALALRSDLDNAGSIVSAGDLAIAAGGALTGNSGAIVAYGNGTLAFGGSVANAGAIQAGGSLGLSGTSYTGPTGSTLSAGNLALAFSGDFTSGGKVEALQSLQLSAASVTNLAGGLMLATTGAVSAAGALSNAGTIAALRSLDLAAAGDLVNSGAIVGPDLVIRLGGAARNDGAIVGGSVLSDGSVLPDGRLGLTAQSYTAASPAALIAAGRADLVVAGAFDNAGAVIGETLLSLSAGAIDNRAGASIGGGAAAITATAGDLANAGAIVAGTGLTLGVAGSVLNSGLIGASAGDLALAASGNVTSSGRIVAAGAMTLDAAAYTGLTGATELGGQTLTIRLSGDFANAGTAAAANGFALQAGNAANAQGGVISGNTVTLGLTGALANAGEIVAATDLAATAAGALTNSSSGAIVAYGNGNLVFGGAIANAGAIQAGSGLTLSGASYAGATGSVVSAYDIALSLGGDFTNNGAVEALRSLSLSAIGVTNSATGLVVAGAAAINAAAGFTNDGALGAVGRLDVSTAGNLANSGAIAAGSAGLQAGGSVANSGLMHAASGLALSGASLANTASGGITADAVGLNLTGSLDNAGVINGTSALAIAAADLTNAGSTSLPAYVSAQDLGIALSGVLTNGPNGLIQGTNAATIAAASVNSGFFEHTQIAQGLFNYGRNLAVDLTGSGYTFTSPLVVSGDLAFKTSGSLVIDSTLAAYGKLTLSSGGSITNGDPTSYPSALVYAGGDMSLAAQGNISNGGTIRSLGQLVMQAGGTVSNLGTAGYTCYSAGHFHCYYPGSWPSHSSTIAADADLTIVAGQSVQNISSQIASGHDLRIVAPSVSNTAITTFSLPGGPTIPLSGPAATLYAANAIYINGSVVTNTGTMVAGTAAPGATGQGALGAPAPSTTASTPSNSLTTRTTNVGGSAAGTSPTINVGANAAAPVNAPSAQIASLGGVTAGPAPTANVALAAAPQPTPGNAIALIGTAPRTPSWLSSAGTDVRSEVQVAANAALAAQDAAQALVAGNVQVIPDYTNPTVRQELQQGTVAFLAANPSVHLGDQLSAAQLASLTAPILWQRTEIAGDQTIAIPEVLMPIAVSASARSGRGSSGSGAGNIYLAGDYVSNAGAILATGDLSIDAGIFVDQRPVYDPSAGIAYGSVVQDGGRIAVGGNIDIATIGDLDVVGGVLSAAGALTLHAGGALNIVSQVAQYTSIQRDGDVTTTTSTTTNYGSSLSAGTVLDLGGGRSITIAASNLAADTINLATPGALSFRAGINDVRSIVEGKSDDLLTTTIYNHGSDTQSLVHDRILAGSGGLNIAAGSIGLDYLAETRQATLTEEGAQQITGTTTQSAAQAIAALAGDPGLSWMSEVMGRQGASVATTGLTLTNTAWNHDQTTLSPAATALISVITAVVAPEIAGALGITADSIGAALSDQLIELAAMPDAAADVLADTIAPAIGQGAMSFGSSAISGSIVSAINGRFDLGEILQNAAAAGLTAGITSGVNASLFGSNTIPAVLRGGGGLAAIDADTVLNSVGQVAVDAPIQAGIYTALTGSDFTEGLVGALRRGAANGIVAPTLMYVAGDIGEQTLGAAAPGSIEEVLLHAGAGALAGAITGGAKGAAGGALGAGLAELALNVDPAGADPLALQNLSQILGGVGSLLAGDASMAGADAALAGYLFNYLNHADNAQRATARSKLDGCNSNPGSCTDEQIAYLQQTVDQLDDREADQQQAYVDCRANGGSGCTTIFWNAAVALSTYSGTGVFGTTSDSNVEQIVAIMAPDGVDTLTPAQLKELSGLVKILVYDPTGITAQPAVLQAVIDGDPAALAQTVGQIAKLGSLSAIGRLGNPADGASSNVGASNSSAASTVPYRAAGTVILQGDAPVCGPACAAMVVSDRQGASVSLADTIGSFQNGVRPTGVNAYEISDVLSNAGVQNTVNLNMTSAQLDQALANGQQVIVNVSNHFFIVDSEATINGATYYMTRDPNAGPRGVLASILQNAMSRSGGVNAIVVGK
ncbi:filamentous hemagglutinin N-terminal domain-containing protein [Bradyrhizobium sp. WD16]|uniref:two-partner secretion domain-containing protein n=1 Tax=Bradyrhizobium sp. WD16 TaxID=1521768 RepID=UPI0020A4CC46|nr:filamentous hemagglutinin N-terminal domain-containing protein [Bradyrhizobium sp. WD16]